MRKGSKFKYFFNPIITFIFTFQSNTMIQNFIADPLLHNYLAPCYPIFIQIRFLLGSITNKKSMKTAKSDIVSVFIILFVARQPIRTRSPKVRLAITHGNDRLQRKQRQSSHSGQNQFPLWAPQIICASHSLFILLPRSHHPSRPWCIKAIWVSSLLGSKHQNSTSNPNNHFFGFVPFRQKINFRSWRKVTGKEAQRVQGNWKRKRYSWKNIGRDSFPDQPKPSSSGKTWQRIRLLAG